MKQLLKVFKKRKRYPCYYPAKETCLNYCPIADCCTQPNITCHYHKKHKKHSK